MTSEDILDMIGEVIRSEIGSNVLPQMTTTSNDVGGWDSMAHARIIYALEERLNIKIDTSRAFSVRNVGELVALIQESRS